MNAVKNIPQGFPNVVDAVEDYQNSIYNIVREISTEYSRQFEGEEEAMQSPMAVTSQSSLKSSQNMQARELREARREKFLIHFNSSQMYTF